MIPLLSIPTATVLVQSHHYLLLATEFNSLQMTFLSILFLTLVRGSFLKSASDLITFLLKTLWWGDTGSFSASLCWCLYSSYAHPRCNTHTDTHTHTPSHLCLTPVLSVLTFSGRTSLIPNAEASALPMAPVHILLSPLPSSRGLLIFLPLPLKISTTWEQGQCDPKWH